MSIDADIAALRNKLTQAGRAARGFAYEASRAFANVGTALDLSRFRQQLAESERAAKRSAERLGALPGGFEDARRAAGDLGAAFDSLADPLGKTNALLGEQVGMFDALREQVPEFGRSFTTLFEEMGEEGRDLDRVVEGLGRRFLTAFEGAIARGESLRDVLRGLALDLARLAIRDFGTGGGLFGKLLGAVGGLFAPGPDLGLGPQFTSGVAASGNFAKGGAFEAGRLLNFARGGAFTNAIVDRPTAFRFARGAGLMGEAGPEAILPLARTSDGRLGVQALVPQGPPAGAAPTMVVNQTLNVSPGVPEAVRREVMALMPEIRRNAVDAILGAVGRGGSVTKAFGLR